MSANAPPGVGLQVGLATNQLDRVLTHAHPSLAFKNIEAAASGYDQQQQNPANPPAGQKQGGAVEQKEESAIFDPRSIGARQARDGHWYVPDQSRLGKYLTPTPGLSQKAFAVPPSLCDFEAKSVLGQCSALSQGPGRYDNQSA